MAKTVMAVSGSTWGSYATVGTLAPVFTPSKAADGSADKDPRK